MARAAARRTRMVIVDISATQTVLVGSDGLAPSVGEDGRRDGGCGGRGGGRSGGCGESRDSERRKKMGRGNQEPKHPRHWLHGGA